LRMRWVALAVRKSSRRYDGARHNVVFVLCVVARRAHLGTVIVTAVVLARGGVLPGRIW
jgi:hypothetical protein